MNDIEERQNHPEFLRMLKAMRRLYYEEKRGLGIWLVGSTLIFIIGSGIVKAIDTVQALISLALVVVAVGEWMALIWIEKRGENAALIQELFDTGLLDLRWNSSVDKPSQAVIHTAADRYDRLTGEQEKAKRPLTDWYAYFVTPGMPLHVARVACQKENCYWENKIRPETVRRTAIGLGILALVLIVITIAFNWTFRQVMTQAAIMLLPIFAAGGIHIYQHWKAQKKIQALEQKCEALWEYVQSPSASVEEATQRSYDLQQEIRHYRAENPPVFDWIYEQVKKKVEEEERLAKSAAN
jgi:hypothetical protein